MLFQTKGDANVVVDFVGVDPQTVLGRVVYSVPYVGYVVDLTRQVEGKVLLIGMPALLLALDGVLALRRRKQKVTAVRGAAGELERFSPRLPRIGYPRRHACVFT